jgi:hypothetical protein
MIGYSQKVAQLNKEASIKNLGVRLGRYCISHDVPVTDVMVLFNVTRQTVYNWFSGIHIPSKDHQKHISTFLNLK